METGINPDSSWAAAAENAQATAPPPQQAAPPAQQQPPVKPAGAPAPTTPQTESQASPMIAQQEQQPLVLQPLKPKGIMGVMSSIADALVGRQRPEMAKDQDGNLYVKQIDMTKGEQWRRIAGTLISGAAAGLAAGKGAGNMGRAAFAGVEQGEKIAQQQKQNQQDMSAEAQKLMLSNANYQMLRMKTAEQAWSNARMKITASQQDQLFSEGRLDRLEAKGGTVLGHIAHPGDLGEVLKADPDVMKTMVKQRQIETVPTFDKDGVSDGFVVVKMPNGFGQQMLPAGAVFHTFDPTTGTFVEHHASEPTAQAEIENYDTKAGNDSLAYWAKKHEQDLHEAQQKEADALAKLHGAQAGAEPSVINKNKAQTAEAQAAAGKDTAEAHKAQSEADMLGGAGAAGNLVDMIGSGHIAADRLAYLLARNPGLVAAVTAKYPDFDSSKAASYAGAYKDFTSGKTSIQLNSGGTALKHLKELSDMNTTKSHIPGTPEWNAYRNKADTVASELAKFYGDATIPAIDAIRSTLAANMAGSRQKAITTQAQSMGDKLDSYAQQWKNAAPSAAYEARMPDIDEGAKEARAAMDPKYKERYVAESQAKAKGQTTQQPTAGAGAGQQWSQSAWKAANPNGDLNAATEAAKAAKYTVVP